jgi:hypothetical protein
MAQSPEQLGQTMIDNLQEKTGKTLPQWLALVSKTKPAKHGEIVKWLKSEHGMTHGFANLVAHKSLKSDAGSAETDDLMAAQYAGPKAGLRPIYDELIKIVSGFGKDVEVSPKKAYVSIRRSKQFAIIQPTTKTRLDVGINLKGEKPTARLEASGSFNAMVSHRVRIEDQKGVDAELRKWLKAGYDAA